MYYFIPSWYGTGRFWQADQAPWYHSQKRIAFDDSIHQLRIFQEAGQDPQLLMLAYQPQLRYFLHRQDLFEVATFSVFDAIQGIEEPVPRNLQVTDLDWSADCDFIYTPFVILVEKAGQCYAEIEFGVEGFISLIRYLNEAGELVREEFYDDRGFVSSILYYEGGQASYRRYLNEVGTWQICEYFDDRGVRVNPEAIDRFEKVIYHEIEELVWEFLRPVLEQVQSTDTFVLASNPQVNQRLLSHLPEKTQKILTCFSERNQADSLESYGAVLSQVAAVVGDRQDFLEQLGHLYPEQAPKLHHLAPYDTRLSLGMSQRVKESKIFYQVDLGQENREALEQVLAYVADHALTTIVFGAFNAPPHQMQEFEQTVLACIDQKFGRQAFEEELEVTSAENQLEENREVTYRYSFVNLVDELDLIKELAYTRLIVDLSSPPHLYTQIAGISAGIPQIHQVASAYVTHLENGYLLESLADFENAADHYLGQLKYWNQALVATIDKIREHTGDRLIQRWESWLEEDNHG